MNAPWWERVIELPEGVCVRGNEGKVRAQLSEQKRARAKVRETDRQRGRQKSCLLEWFSEVAVVYGGHRHDETR